MRFLVWALALNVGLILLLLVADGIGIWGAVLFIWLNMVLYCVREFWQRIYLLAFLLAFFIFLVGRTTLSELFGYQDVSYSPQVLNHLGVALIIALVAVFVGHLVVTKLQRARASRHPGLYYAEDGRTRGVRQASALVFWITLPLAYYFEFDRVSIVLSSGYADLYSESFRNSAATGAMAIVGQIALVNVVALAMYLATMPAMRSARPLVLGWSGLLVLSLASGQRSTFITGFLFLACYAVLRSRVTPNDRWITRRGIAVLALSVPILILLLVAIETVRGVGADYDGGLMAIAVQFIFNQGVSSTVITNGFLFASAIPEQQYLLEFTRSGLIARLLDLPVLQGNSIERALDGNSFAHSLSYVVLGEPLYLAGRGTGSSFVAEAFQDYGYLGIFVVALVFGGLLALFEAMRVGRLLFNTVCLLIVQDVFWAPRSSATGFLSTLFAPSSLVAIAVVFMLGLAFAARSHNSSKTAKAPVTDG